MESYTALCKKVDPSLPGDWEVYLAEWMPRPRDGQDWNPTHMRLVGSVCRLLKSGKRKGQKTWRDGIGEKEFIFSAEELRSA